MQKQLRRVGSSKDSQLSIHKVKKNVTGVSEVSSQGQIVRLNSEGTSDGGMASLEMASIGDDHQSGSDVKVLNKTFEEDTGGENDSPLQQSAQGPQASVSEVHLRDFVSATTIGMTPIQEEPDHDNFGDSSARRTPTAEGFKQ